MARSHTRKKLSNKPRPIIHSAVPRDVTKAAADHIAHWTHCELDKLQRIKSSPICIETKQGYKIGMYSLRVFRNKTCDVYDHTKEYIHTFENKVSAVLYTILTIKRRYNEAYEIIQLDTEINKNYTDVLFFRRSINRALQKRDFATVDVKVARLEVAENKLIIAREQVAKRHNHAKWHKIWQ